MSSRKQIKVVYLQIFPRTKTNIPKPILCCISLIERLLTSVHELNWVEFLPDCRRHDTSCPIFTISPPPASRRLSSSRWRRRDMGEACGGQQPAALSGMSVGSVFANAMNLFVRTSICQNTAVVAAIAGPVSVSLCIYVIFDVLYGEKTVTFVQPRIFLEWCFKYHHWY